MTPPPSPKCAWTWVTPSGKIHPNFPIVARSEAELIRFLESEPMSWCVGWTIGAYTPPLSDGKGVA
jgi:hypothetical protein